MSLRRARRVGGKETSGQHGAASPVEKPFRSPWRIAITALNVLAAVSTIAALFARDLFGLDGPRWAELLVIWFAVSMAALFVALVLVQWSDVRLLLRAREEYARRARSAEAAGFLSDAHGHVRDAIHAVRNGADCAESLHASLTAVAQCYTFMTGSACRASVKRLGYEGNEPTIRDFYVETFGRDMATGWKRHDQGRDRVTDNTDFEVLFEDPDRPWWFANDLTDLSPYKNSHWDESTVPSQAYEYVATVVWPIRRAWREPAGTPRHELHGYLCVDTLSKGAFSEDADYGYGASLAAHLYALMTELDQREGDVLPAEDHHDKGP